MARSILRAATGVLAATALVLTGSPASPAAADPSEGSAHTVDILFLEAPGVPLASDSQLRGAVRKIDEFWPIETGGAISDVAVGEVKKIRISGGKSGQLLCSSDKAAKHDWVASQFGRTYPDYLRSSGRHLLVIESTTACDHKITGYGTLGKGVESGGLIWLQLDQTEPERWRYRLLHEFGHNLGLGHSDELICPSGTVDTADVNAPGADGSGCTVKEYGDGIDIMGTRFTYGGGYAQDQQFAALNVTHRIALGMFGEDDVRKVSAQDGAASAVDLKPSTDDVGTRAVEITDPVTGQLYLLEYRAGQGRDAAAPYAAWPDGSPGRTISPGVRVLRPLGDRESVVLNRPGLSDDQAGKLGDNSYVAGEAFAGSSGLLRVDIRELTPENAALCVTFTATEPTISATPPRVSGTGSVGAALTATVDGWTPGTATVNYQWLRDGAVIAGADGATYRPTDADAGAAISVRAIGTQECYRDASSESTPLTVHRAGGGSGTDPEIGSGTGAAVGFDPDDAVGTDPDDAAGTDPGDAAGTDPDEAAGTDPDDAVGTDPGAAERADPVVAEGADAAEGTVAGSGSGAVTGEADSPSRAQSARDLAVTGGSVAVALLGGASVLLLLGWLLQRRRQRA